MRIFIPVVKVAELNPISTKKRFDSSGVSICKSVVNDLRHGNFIRKSEVNYLPYEHRVEIPVEFAYVNQ